MINRKSIQVSEETKKRVDLIKADLQCDYNTLLNKLCEMYEHGKKGKRSPSGECADWEGRLIKEWGKVIDK